MKRVIIVGSPRSNGRSAHLAEMLFEASIDERPEDEVFLVPVSELEIMPCVACDGCRNETEFVYEDKDKNEVRETGHHCVIDDEMQDVYPLLATADELVVVSPVFFSGAPASMKALLDRLQPYFWANARKAEKRPATLHVIGEGDDPHGFDPLVSEVRSALAVAGFRLERVLDWVGKIDRDGEILEEASVVQLGSPKAAASAAAKPSSDGVAGESRSGQRPKLDLGTGKAKSQSGKGSAGKGRNGNAARSKAAGKKNPPAKGGHRGR